MLSILGIILTYKEGLLLGLWVTLKLCLVIWLVGLFIGTILGYLSSKYHSEIGVPTRIIAFILSGIPVLVLLFWLHYPLQAMLEIVIDPFFTTCFALSIVNIFAVSEIVRSALDNFPTQYNLAAKVCGLSKKETFTKIELPIIFRQIIPSLLSLQVTMLQLTIFASLISVEEIFRVGQRINSLIYQPVEIYTAMAIFFLIVCLPMNGLALWLKYKFTRNISEQ
ncbi:MAG: ABC transporter permease subunit [Candidatus Staskawiczbacteria bacterium]|nr:ABC transporter permease subunit [Candidatus Staskawiczbacteria bacterium]